MQKGKKWRYLLVCAVILLCATTLCACGKDADAPELKDYFSDSDKKQWKNDEKECRHSMNGGYFLYYKGEYYPVEFHNGKLFWVTSEDNYSARSEELIFAQLKELYTDKKCEKRCAYLGYYKEWSLFGNGPSWTGYILDGNRPAYGSVLYVDETNEVKSVFKTTDSFWTPVNPSNGYAPDEVITSSRMLMLGSEFLTNEDGTMKEHVNTPRKLLAYLMEIFRGENGKIWWSEPEEYTYVRSFGTFSLLHSDYGSGQKLDLGGWTKDEAYAVADRWINMRVTEVSIADTYHIYLDYQNESLTPKHFMLFTSPEEAKRYTDLLQNDGRYTDIELNEANVVCRYFDTDNNEEVTVFHSFEEVNRILEQETVIDQQNQKALAYFTRYPTMPEKKFDGHLDYYVPAIEGGAGSMQMYAVWEDYRTVQLHTPDSVQEVIVSEHNDAVLPRPLYPNHEFVGWYADESYSGQPITTLTNASGYENLYAKFRKVDYYTLTFEPHDGKTMESIQYVYGEEFTLPMLTKAFHIFKGWYADPDCKTEPITAISTELYGSYHLYPCFEARKYTVTLHHGEQVKDIQVAYGAEFATTWGVTEAGFLGYFDENGVQYTDENGKSLAPFTDGADIQLFARYKEE